MREGQREGGKKFKKLERAREEGWEEGVIDKLEGVRGEVWIYFGDAAAVVLHVDNGG